MTLVMFKLLSQLYGTFDLLCSDLCHPINNLYDQTETLPLGLQVILQISVQSSGHLHSASCVRHVKPQ